MPTRTKVRRVVRAPLVIAVLGAVGTGAFVMSISTASDQEDETAARHTAASVPTTALRNGSVFECALSNSREQQYKGHLSIKTAVRLRALYSQVAKGVGKKVPAGVVPLQEVHSGADWLLDSKVVRADRDGGGVVAVRLADLDLEGMPVVEGIGQTFLVEIGRKCEIVRFGWHDSISRPAAASQQAFVSLLNYELPESGKPSAFRGTGVDQRGEYRYRAVLSSARSDWELIRRKQSYSSSEGSNNSASIRQGVTGEGLRVELESGLWFGGATLSEVWTLGPATELLARHEVDFSIRMSDGAVAGVDVDWSDSHWKWGDLTTEPPQGSHRGVNAVAAAMTLDDVLAQLQESGGDNRLLKAWLLADASRSQVLASWILTNGADGAVNKRLAKSMIRTLGESGTPMARQALRSLLLDEQLYGPLRVASASTLSRSKPLRREDLDALIAMGRERLGGPEDGRGITEYPAAAGLSLVGAAAHDAALTDAALAARGIEELRRQLETPDSDRFVRAALMGAGNAGSPELLAAVEPYLDDESAAVRAEAVSAIRRMPMDATEQLFIEQMAVEQIGMVRESLSDAAWNQMLTSRQSPPAGMVDAAIEAFEDPRNRGIESSLTRMLGTAARTSPAAQAALAERFKTELEKGEGANTQMLAMIGNYLTAEQLRD